MGHETTGSMTKAQILDVPIGVVTMDQVIQQVNDWVATADRSHLVTFANVHMIVEAQRRPAFKLTLQQMDLNCPDGAPIYWLVKSRFGARVRKIAGPEFMPKFCEQSALRDQRHFLYGGPPGVSEQAGRALVSQYPGIKVVGHYCPPFRKLSESEVDQIVSDINATKPDLIWVCLGCPKQEQWMADLRDRLDAKVILAVGQAFDILAGRTGRSPALLTRLGGEWAYRLIKEPRRLWKRYLVTNTLFVVYLLRASFMRSPSRG